MDALLQAAILIVDDHEPNVLLLRRIVEGAGYARVYSTTDSRRVLALIDEIEPDLILLDLHMPAPDGLTLLRQLGDRTREGEYLPVLVITADIQESVKEEALRLGAKDFLSKPFNATEAVLRVRNLLQARLLHVNEQRENRLLETKVQERTRDVEAAQFEILDRLALVSDFRDDVTGEHARRVGRMTDRFARALGLSGAESELYRWAAPLHDLGKVGIRDDILLKPGRLTAAEWERMKEHTSIGAKLLAGSRFPILQLAEEIALTHHERWDGRGYMGLSGDSIPLSGRLVSVCDVFDALTHERPYKPAWPVDRALQEIREQSGLMFEPRMADAFVALAKEWHLAGSPQ